MTHALGNLLIVDDEPQIQNILVMILKKYAATVQKASNGKEAFALVRSGSIDAVLSDINMPVMNGLELLYNVRDMGLETPFVFLTGYADKEKSVEALRLGATDFLEKPFQPENVIDVMKKALALGVAIREIAEETEKLYISHDIPIDERRKLQKMKQSLLVMKKFTKIYSNAS